MYTYIYIYIYIYTYTYIHIYIYPYIYIYRERERCHGGREGGSGKGGTDQGIGEEGARDVERGQHFVCRPVEHPGLVIVFIFDFYFNF